MRTVSAVGVSLFLLATALTAVAREPKLTADEIVAKHLQSIAPADTLAAFKSRGIQGTVHNEIVVGGVGNLDGVCSLMSDGRKFSLVMRFPSNDYPGEHILSNDDKDDVALIAAGARSPLGNFLYREQEILDEGLFGGVLSSSWPLLDIKDRQPRLKFDGIKKIDGVALYELSYIPQKPRSDLKVHLYFDPATFHHVRTTYRFAVQPGMLGGPIGTGVSEIQHVTYVTLQEDFSDFHTVGGFNLPTRWKLTYIIDNENGLQIKWDINLSRIVNNPTIDPKEFDIH
jgi:hypothetical protein